MSEWTKIEDGAKLKDGVYFCAYGTGPYIGILDYDADKQEFKTPVDRMQILEWRPAPKNPFDQRAHGSDADRIWRDYEVEKPVESGKYMCRYLHNYKMGDLHYSPEDGWEGKFMVTHYMKI